MGSYYRHHQKFLTSEFLVKGIHSHITILTHKPPISISSFFSSLSHQTQPPQPTEASSTAQHSTAPYPSQSANSPALPYQPNTMIHVIFSAIAFTFILSLTHLTYCFVYIILASFIHLATYGTSRAKAGICARSKTKPKTKTKTKSKNTKDDAMSAKVHIAETIAIEKEQQQQGQEASEYAYVPSIADRRAIRRAIHAAIWRDCSPALPAAVETANADADSECKLSEAEILHIRRAVHDALARA
ncbi:uncharacterized protein K452DRAFT_8555 [Aplosporella prunicola CBS 121167]|uniref:Uncharacterized protein n=1 Tax=Aplosporella prunicola CBS 121167 TaxID=1176127 RepID=A0A6A6BX96_9PEZI|nr:uncharacterized protein K452DRAFT_8555 [Aplosporella prunicola CBS 121167]KAF2147527.1 hypothetical protein K452DRAFT_8555 [Aplosporella prunicola CBS 121167]